MASFFNNIWDSIIPFLGDQNISKNLLSIFDDEKFRKEMLDTHAPDEGDVDVQSLFLLINNTLSEATVIVDSVVNPKGTQGSASTAFKPPEEGFNPPIAAINEVACQITCKALDTKNVRKTFESLFRKLLTYSWVAKAVITLSSLALYYSDFWLLAQPTGKLTKSMAILKGLPAITKSPDVQKIQVFRDLNDIIKIILSMTECIVEFEHDSKDVPELSTTIDIPGSVYQIIICVLVCSIQFTSLINLVDDYKGKDLQPFARKVNKINHSIQADFEDYKHRKESIKGWGEFSMPPLIMWSSSRPCFTSRTILSDSSLDKKYKVESLRKKCVMLLISDLNLSPNDISILKMIYKEPKFKEKCYEIMWVPIIDQEGEDTINQFKHLQSQMLWYSVCSPTLINKVAIKMIKEKWHFRQKTIVTVLDPQGRVSNQNAMSLIRVWGWHAFPFTDSVIADLWKPDIDRFELLVTDMIFPNIHEVIKSEKYILLYGSEDPKAIQEIEEPLKKIKDDGIPIVSHNVNMPLFWSRLESCMHLKLQTNANVPEALMRDILNLYTNFKRHGGFVVLTKGSRIVTNDSIVTVTEVFSKYETEWKSQVTPNGMTFDMAFMDFRNQVYDPPRCNDFCIPTIVDYIPENMKCPDCPSMMKINFNFECCHGAH
ncbi:protein SIEVE ELEMENT OCCLUSION B-like isoform X2 [Syzygium oleosum]|uniref:protein SIEVE ELEMENT OCCLUSION B-like isoform X2 n=1 Tax=Syzygium oleosum TaxID=219896 RepID=UPI0024BA2EE3|nr:protein SIEVE ELEMENT OCCLUSION B-like isoform X2 [Syzygium oleosum]